MSLAKANENLKYDIRMLEYNLAHGIITKEEYEKILKELPDCSHNVDLLNIEDSEFGDQQH